MFPTWDRLVSKGEIITRKAGMASLAHSMTEVLAIPELVNRHVAWDASQARISPGILCKALILNLLSHRTPLYPISQFFSQHDTSLYFGEGVTTEDLIDDRFGWFLDRLAEANPEKFFMQMALRDWAVRHMDAKILHADTASISLQGVYETGEAGDVSITMATPKTCASI